MIDRKACFLIGLVWASLCTSVLAEEAKKPSDFTGTVVHKAISFMPTELMTKLTAAEKAILASAKPQSSQSKSASQTVYFVDKEEGTGPATLVEQFRLVRKGVSEKSSYSTLAPALGRLARCVIALSQPYHTEEAAFKGTAHATFEKELDSSCGSLKADFDGYQKIDNPSEFAVQLAKRGNDLLKQLSSTEGEGATGVPSAVFVLAANSVADCWWTLLTGQTDKASTETSTSGNFIGNKRSLKFHLPTCKYLPAEKNRVYFQSRDDAISEGYVPCKVCNP